MGIKIPGLAPTRHLPWRVEQICCSCWDCCLYMFRWIETNRWCQNWRPVGRGFGLQPSCLCTGAAFLLPPSWIWPLEQLEQLELHESSRATVLEFQWHCWTGFRSFLALGKQEQQKTETKKPKWIKKGGWRWSQFSLCGSYKDRLVRELWRREEGRATLPFCAPLFSLMWWHPQRCFFVCFFFFYFYRTQSAVKVGWCL